MLKIRYSSCCLLVFISLHLGAQTDPAPTGKEIIYGRKDGMALTLRMLTPKKQNGKAIISMVSGGWYSSEEWIPGMIENARIFLERGYTVFLVMHSGRPMFTITDAISDARRSVRFIRYHAAEYHIDAKRIGITGSSSGGQLSLAVGTADDLRDSASKDPIDAVSSRVQAVACFYPPSDFLHWGNVTVDLKNKYILDQADVYSAFEFKEWDPRHKYFAPVTDTVEVMRIYHAISPYYQVTGDDPPVLIAHGNADPVVPYSQSVRFMEKLQSAGIPHQLLTEDKGAHGNWKDEPVYLKAFADWFDKYL